MLTSGSLNVAKLRDEEQATAVSFPMRSLFEEWLKKVPVKGFSTETILCCIDKVSDRAIEEHVTAYALWDYKNYDDFKSIYDRLNDPSFVRIIDTNRLKVFMKAGALYLRFLKEKPFIKKSSVVEKRYIRVTAPTKQVSADTINQKDFLSWLKKEISPDGAARYMEALHSAPDALTLSSSVNRNIFACRSLAELDSLSQIFKTSSDYDYVNRIQWNGRLSGGLLALRRYLKLIEPNTTQVPLAHEQQQIKPKIISPEEKEKKEIHVLQSVAAEKVYTKITSQAKQVSADAINQKDFLSWLKKEISHDGAVWCMKALCSAPDALTLSSSVNRNIFACRSLAELDSLSQIFKTSSNYDYVNRIQWNGRLSGGLAALKRYLKLIEPNTTQVPLAHKQQQIKPKIILPEEKENAKKHILLEDLFLVDEKPQTPLLNHVNKSTDDLWLTSSDSVPRAIQTELFATSDNVRTSLPLSSAELISKLTSVLLQYYSNGYRLTSVIESDKFCDKAKSMGIELAMSNEALQNCIKSCGIILNEKVYVVPTETKENIKKIAEDYFVAGARVIFFDEFYAKHEDWLVASGVGQKEILTVALRGLFPRLFFFDSYFGFSDDSVITSVVKKEIIRVWDNDIILTYSQLSDRLPYIPVEKIKDTLIKHKDFIWHTDETYTHISKVEITAEDREIIRYAARRECGMSGYVSFLKLPLCNVREQNYELSDSAICDSVYQLCLSDKFDKERKIFSLKGQAIDARAIAQEYFRTLGRCTLDDLADYWEELTGTKATASMEIGNNVMVRIDKDTYVADRYVYFDVDLIDKAIYSVCTGNYLPIRFFTAFGVFPHCGQSWNLFLLESYCRRFSKEFSFDNLTHNSSNIGAIIRKSCKMSYIDVMADAVLKAKVSLVPDDVGLFLFDNGYTGSRKTSKASDIIEKANVIRKVGN